MHGLNKFAATLGIAARLIMARTFGRYVHSIAGPDQPDCAVYEWRGKTWWIPTGPAR